LSYSRNKAFISIRVRKFIGYKSSGRRSL